MTNLQLLKNANDFALIGINPDKEKFAHRIYSLLKEKNKNVYGVNHKYPSVDGDTVYPSILDIDHSIDIVVMVVNPTIGITMLDDFASKGIRTLWLQPGTASEQLITKAEGLGMNVIQDCVLAQYAHEKGSL